MALGPKSGSPAIARNSAPIDAIEQTTSAGAGTLQYDSATDQHIYACKTQKSWAGTCRQLTVELADGQQHVAQFTFK
jgi:hypothetical protein